MTDIQIAFEKLAARWSENTGHLSSMTKKVSHPAYQEIIRMGAPAVPFILARLKRIGGWWFHALAEITGENPTTEEMRGKYQELKAAWLQWGREHGHDV